MIETIVKKTCTKKNAFLASLIAGTGIWMYTAPKYSNHDHSVEKKTVAPAMTKQKDDKITLDYNSVTRSSLDYLGLKEQQEY